MTSPAVTQRMTFDAFLAWESGQPTRHEFANGEVFAMAGGTAAHDAVTGALREICHARARARGCVALGPNMMVRIAAVRDEAGLYPDVLVTCEAVENEALFVSAPEMIAEVLAPSPAPSTARDDRIDKWAFYRLLPTLKAYVLVDWKRRRVEVYSRDGAGWLLRDHGADDTIELPILGQGIVVAELFRDLK
jgi:Uma2 family endonuclease